MARMDRYKKQPEEVYRAVYPDEPPLSMTRRTDEDWTAYPDSYYAEQRQDQPMENEAPPRYAQFEEDENFSARRGYMPPSQGSWNWQREGAPRKRSNTPFWTMIAFICVGLLSLMGYWVYSMHEAYLPFREMVKVTEQKTFAQGIMVDDIHIGGMTKEQAKTALQSRAESDEKNLNITLDIDGQIWYLTKNELPFERNIASVLETAYAIGRQGSAETISSSVTPIEYRYAHLYHTVSNPAYLYTQVTYDKARVRELAGIIEANIDRAPVDAMVDTFDFNTRSFTFTQDYQGADLDGEALYNQMIAALDRRDYNARITMEAEKILPTVTKVALMNSFALVSTYTTETTSSANRNTNIDLAARAVMGTVVMPGETFSFNKATGQRTTEKGYLPAAAIAGGTTVDEVGGGVCQVSSTLFNAAAMADLTILTRSPHTWPSTYVDKGRDATVNWPNLDFTFRNDKDTPIFIVSYYQNRKITVELYGATLEPGITIDLQTRVVSTTYPPDEPIYEQNPTLAYGTVQEKKKARTGYEVETYKIYYRNGVEIRRELLCNSSYKMIQQVIEYN